MSSDAFIARVKELRDPIDAALAAAFVTPGSADLARYCYRPAADFTAAGGKRVRPALVCLAAELTGVPAGRALGVAAAVEHFQTAALIHDDIADESDTRRGEPCVHVKEGVGLAINTGDLALVESFASVVYAEGVDAPTKVRMLDELYRMMVRTIEGQALDLGWARDKRWDITPADYLEMATLKTAHYSAATPLVLGALIGHADEGRVEALRACGMAAGLAFQLQDDLLNIVGDADGQGKDFRSDITEGKRTLLVVEALERLDGERGGELVSILGAHTKDPYALSRAASLIEASGAVDAVRERADALTAEAEQALAGVEWPDALPGALEALEAMPEFFVRRSA